MLIVEPLDGRLTQRFGGGRVAVVGVSILCLSTLPVRLHRRPHLDPLRSRSCWSCAGVGIGLSFMPAMTAAFASLRTDQLSDATPQMNVLQRVGGAIGTAVLAVVLQRAGADAHTPGGARRAPSTPPTGGRSGSSLLSLIPCLDAAARRAPARPPAGRPMPRPRRALAESASRPALSDPRRSRRAQRAERPRSRDRRSRERAGSSSCWTSARPSGASFAACSRLRGRDTHLGGSELSHAQFELLIELHERGPLPAGELATAAQLTPATVTQMLDHLAASGHVERARSEHRPARRGLRV